VKTARKPKEKKPLESLVQKRVIANLKRIGIKAHRRNVAAMKGEYKGKERFVKCGEKGQSDLWFLLLCNGNARHVELELKRLDEKPTYHQIIWLRETNEITGASFWADSTTVVDNVVRALMDGARIVYHEGQSFYPNPIKGGKGKVLGPSYEYDVEF
jgi:hypothetical protein